MNKTKSKNKLKKKKKVKKAKNWVIQNHHLLYPREDKQQKEVTALIRRNEHWVLTQLSRLNPVSKGLIKSLKFFIVIKEDDAIDLKKYKEENR